MQKPASQIQPGDQIDHDGGWLTVERTQARGRETVIFATDPDGFRFRPLYSRPDRLYTVRD